MATSFETPDSSIVTPYSTSAPATVRLLWVMTMNCEFAANSFRRLASLPTFSSSSAASISSRRQNGEGFTM